MTNKQEQIKNILDLMESLDISIEDLNGNSKQELSEKLINAARGDNLDEIKESLKKGADVNAKDEYGYTALMWASLGGHEGVVKLLLKKGAYINSKNEDGHTALMLASCWGREGVVKLLLKKGADINTRDEDGWTALMWASHGGHEGVVKILEDHINKNKSEK